MLNSAPGVMLGVAVMQRHENETTFAIGDLLLMYTDRLVDDDAAFVAVRGNEAVS